MKYNILTYLKENANRLIPLIKNEKIPRDKGWTKKKYSKEEIREHKGNIGFRTGKGILVIDVDGDIGLKSLQLLEKKLDLKITKHITTVSENSYHCYCIVDEDITISQKHKKLYPKIDFQYKARYVVIPPSKIDGKEYKFISYNLPTNLSSEQLENVGLINTTTKIVTKNIVVVTIEEMKKDLDKISSNTDRDRWLRIGMAIHYSQPNEEGYQLFLSWSRKDGYTNAKGKKPKETDIRTNWKSFKTKLEKEPVTWATVKRLINLQKIDKDIPISKNPILKNRRDKYGCLHSFILLNSQDKFIHIYNKKIYSKSTFNSLMQPYIERNEDGKKQNPSTFYNHIPCDFKVADKIDFRPDIKEDIFKDVNNINLIVNTFDENKLTKSIPITDEGQQYIETFINHLYMICNFNQEKSDILLYWFAHQIQFVGKKIHYAPLIQGMKGCGKGYICNILSHVIGTDFCAEIGEEELSRDFNSAYMADTLFVHLDDLKISDKLNYNYIKRIITSSTLLINKKGTPEYKISNNVNFIVTTNHADALHKDTDTDERRWYVICHDCYDKSELNKQIEKATEGTFDNEQAYFNYLQNEDNMKKFAPMLRTYLEKENFEIPQSFLNMTRAIITDDFLKMLQSKSERIQGFTEISDMISSSDNPLINKEWVLVSELKSDLEFQHANLKLSTVKITDILKKLQFSLKRIKIKGENKRVWLKNSAKIDDIKQFLKNYENNDDDLLTNIKNK